jgi:hypothetical protein
VKAATIGSCMLVDYSIRLKDHQQQGGDLSRNHLGLQPRQRSGVRKTAG